MATKQAVDRLAILCALAAPPLTGCANGIPKGTLSYFLPKAQTTLTVTQTLTCNAAGDALFQVVTVNPSTVYSSDTSQPQKIIPSSISSAVSDADISFTFTDDGRLSGVNTATTGQGGAIVKSALAVAKVAGLVAAHTPPPTDAKNACVAIGVLAPKPKADSPPSSVTITYVRSFEYDNSSATDLKLKDGNPNFDPEFGTSFANYTYLQTLRRSIPKLGFDVQVKAGSSRKLLAPTWTTDKDPELALQLNGMAAVTIEVRGLSGNLTGTNREPVWSGDVLVPLTAKSDLINVPIPKPAFFGQRKFSLTLAPSGSITKIGYVSTGASDAADALGAIGSAVLASPKELTTAQQAAALQAQADLIFQQQRLANCQSKPESCTK
ncbi:hypothetical protein [Roseateles puraquae]|uniref:hypothetical protein n=1 Tax=Roseateles puraquae TaxID=431059 RepID=UPI0031DCCA90